MSVTRPTFEEICEAVAPIAAKHGIIRVYLFGSRARGDDREGSDIDFFVVPPEGCGAMSLGSFLYDLEDAFGTDVDVIAEGSDYRPSFIEEVLRDRRLVFEARV
ncbi:MAG: nucleotidyltransferase domain-containing protein [Candidatus Methanoplasma sp.]|jgi:predicted nucleotidyltransferase|nr:nucleotidyltransferase domain-containing protein [Candidatus Methanoplasma sp.]